MNLTTYTLGEAADVLGIGRRHIQTLINGDAKKGIPARLAHFQVGHKKMIREDDLLEFLDANRKVGP
jgi:excisionase family DNA binding protein